MMHEPDCPLFSHTIEGRGRKKKYKIIKVNPDQEAPLGSLTRSQLAKRKQLEDKVNAGLDQPAPKEKEKEDDANC